MLATGTILERDQPLRLVNPLSVSINSSSKKRLILDLRYVNMHLYKDTIKFDGWKCFKNCLLANKGYLFKFDLKNGYHHIDIFDSHQTYLGFLGILKGLQIILYSLSYPFAYPLQHFFYKSCTSFSEALALARRKNCLFSRQWFRYSIHISKCSFML